jgi:hypothetical protein
MQPAARPTKQARTTRGLSQEASLNPADGAWLGEHEATSQSSGGQKVDEMRPRRPIVLSQGKATNMKSDDEDDYFLSTKKTSAIFVQIYRCRATTGAGIPVGTRAQTSAGDHPS